MAQKKVFWHKTVQKKEEKWYKHKFNLLLRVAREGTLLGLDICVENFDVGKRRGHYYQKELTEVAIVELFKGRSF